LERDSANPAHPLNRFATGNKDTLSNEAVAQGIDLRSRLVDFHRNYYTTERMTLAVQGNQPLADLEKWVKETFLDINSSLGDSIFGILISLRTLRHCCSRRTALLL
jgi:insulysin